MSFYRGEPDDVYDDSLTQDADSEHRYPCSCGNPACIADDREPGNYRIRGEWYSASCETAKFHPDVIGDVLSALHQDEVNDDFNARRR